MRLVPHVEERREALLLPLDEESGGEGDRKKRRGPEHVVAGGPCAERAHGHPEEAAEEHEVREEREVEDVRREPADARELKE